MSKLTKKTLTKSVTVWRSRVRISNPHWIMHHKQSSHLEVIEEEGQIIANPENHLVSFWVVKSLPLTKTPTTSR